MKRRFAALAVLAATLVLPRNAEAQSAMCAEPAAELLTVGGTALAPRGGATARRVALSGIAPALRGGTMSVPSEAPSPMRDEDLPWCASAEDPRCAPLHGDSTSIRIALRHPVAAGSAFAPQRPTASDDDEFTPDAGLAPRAGISNRVERPPRPSR
jgi:hypothetical protein